LDLKEVAVRILKSKSCRVILITLSAALLIFSCVANKNKTWVSWALNVALHDELSPAQEAVAWTLSQTGKVSTCWIKNDAAGVLLTASRTDLAIPVGSALWHLESSDNDGDGEPGDDGEVESVEFVEFKDLVSGDTFTIYLDPAAKARADRDGGDEDAGLPEESKGKKDKCDTRTIQSRPMPLVSVGPYLFLKWEEQTLDCDDSVMLKQDRYTAVDLSRGEETDILNEEEQETLFEKPDVKALGKDVELEGTVPFYNPAFGLSFVHIISEVSTEISDEGETRSYVNSVEISDTRIPDKLKDFYMPPDLVQAFGLSLPDEVLGGFVAIEGSSEDIEKQLRAFIGEKPGVTSTQK
jgi:hypothetical protein